MRYWKFDPINLIRDYKANQNACASIQLEIKLTKDEIKNPFIESDIGQCDRRLKQLELKLEEYQMYVDLVTLGFDALSSTQRRALELRYIEGLDIADAGKEMHLSNSAFEKLDKRSLIAFARIVSPM